MFFKCAHADVKGQWKDFFFLLPPLQQPHSWYNSYHSHLWLLLQRYRELYFPGACQIISTARTMNASPPHSFLHRLSHSAAELPVSPGSCFFARGLAALAGSHSGTSLTPTSSPAHTCPSVRPCWGRSRRTVGIVRSQTALNGPKQAVRINNLLRLQGLSSGAA